MITFRQTNKHEIQLRRQGHILGYLYTIPRTAPCVVLTDRAALLRIRELDQIVRKSHYHDPGSIKLGQTLVVKIRPKRGREQSRKQETRVL